MSDNKSLFIVCIHSIIFQVLVLASNASCPSVWHYYNNDTGECECGHGLFCSTGSNKVLIRNGKSEKEGDYYYGFCPFFHPINSTNRLYSEMPSNVSELDKVMCGPYNRKGLLCGDVHDGYGPSVYSFDLKCAKCSSLWTVYGTAISLLLQFSYNIVVYYLHYFSTKHNFWSSLGLCVIL